MTMLQLRASDGHTLHAYAVKPEGTPRGAIVVVQEIFGVNSHIRRIVEQYAAQGYLAIAPAMFDRVRPGIELSYDADAVAEGVELMTRMTPDGVRADLRAAISTVAHAGLVGMVGYCWGGRITAMAACRSNIAAGVAYYGGGIAQLLGETPRCPLLCHFGEQDSHIPLSDVEQIRKAWPQVSCQLYPAGHGFNCPDRTDFDAASAHLAFERTLEFFRRHVG